MKKILSILFTLIFIFCLVSCDSPSDDLDDKETKKTYVVQFVDPDGLVLGTKKVEEGDIVDEPDFDLSDYNVIAWLNDGKEWDFHIDKVYSDITLKLHATKHEHIYVNGKCECGKVELINGLPVYSEDELNNLTANISFWHVFGSKGQEVLVEIIKEFNKIYPNIQVTHESKGSYEKLQYNIAKFYNTNQLPTIAQATSEDISFYLELNRSKPTLGLTSMNNFISHPLYGLSDSQMQDFEINYLEQCKMFDSSKTYYSLPFTRQTEVLYFNASWFEEKGLLEKYNLGTIDYVDGTMTFIPKENASLTWDEIEEIGKLFIEQPEYKNLSSSEKNLNFAFSYDEEDNLFINLTKQWGGEYISPNESHFNEILFNNAQSKSMLEWYKKGYNNGYFVTGSAWGDHDGNSSEGFINGQIKMVVGSSGSARYKNPENKFVVGVLPYPQKDVENKAVISSGSDLIIFNTKEADEQLAGWLFIKFLTTWQNGLDIEKQPTYMLTKENYTLPIISSVKNSLEYNQFLVENNYLGLVQKVAAKQLEYSYTVPVIPLSSRCREAVENLVESVLYAGALLENAYRDALDELQ